MRAREFGRLVLTEVHQCTNCDTYFQTPLGITIQDGKVKQYKAPRSIFFETSFFQLHRSIGICRRPK